MKTFENIAAQGDVMIVRITKIPEGAKRVLPVDGKFIVAHSETGHHHVIEARPNVCMLDSADPLVSYLEVVEATDATETLLEHLRDFDTHESLGFSPGVYEIRRGRESTPEGWRRTAD